MTPESLNQKIENIIPGQLAEDAYWQLFSAISKLKVADDIKGELFIKLDNLREQTPLPSSSQPQSATPSNRPPQQQTKKIPIPALITTVPIPSQTGAQLPPPQTHVIHPLKTPTPPLAQQPMNTIPPYKAYDQLEKILEASPLSQEEAQDALATLEKSISDTSGYPKPSAIFEKQITELVQRAKNMIVSAATAAAQTTIENLSQQLQDALAITPFDSAGVQLHREQITRALQNAPKGIPLTITAQAHALIKTAENRIQEEQIKAQSKNTQKKLTESISRELSATGPWSQVRYSHVKELISRLTDDTARDQFSQQLENSWQKSQAEATTEEIIHSIQNWSGDLASDIQTSIEKEKNFDKKTKARLIDLLNATYKAVQAAPTPTRPTIPMDLCKRVNTVNENSDDETINALMKDLRTKQ
ncbi:MAG: hypothetical protein U1E02_29125, partial [Hydrogenophaga sp.]|nr:hypothetical protein [Hydrogenophaga sp.]